MLFVRAFDLRGVSDLADPVGVVELFAHIFAVRQGVPQSDFSIGTTGQNLSVIGGECNSEDFLVMAFEDS